MEDKKEIFEKSGDKTADYKDYKSKQGGRRYNRRDRRNSRGAKGMPTKGGNDFAFWNEYPELMDIATRFPWFHIAGTPLTSRYVSVNLPNVAVQHYVSIPGTSRNATDPMNLAFRQLYLDMHRKYRGIGTYQASDIAIAMLCIESVLQLIVEAERIYGILKGYPIKSRIEPEGLLLAMGYTQAFIDDVKSNLADYRYGVNRIIDFAKRLPLPAGMNFFKNHVALNGFVYRDSQDERSGLLVFVCDNYYSWGTTGGTRTVNGASTAVSNDFNRSGFTGYNALLLLIQGLLTTLLTDSDVLRITSDFIACYGENNMQVLTPLPEDYRCEPLYSESILHKWHNSERSSLAFQGTGKLTYGAISSSTTRNTNPGFVVYQENDVIVSLPVISPSSATTWSATNLGPGMYAYMGTNSELLPVTELIVDHVIDSWMADVSKEFACEATLWKVQEIQIGNTGVTPPVFAHLIEKCGTEVLTTLEVCRVANSAVVGIDYYQTSIDVENSSEMQDALCHFDWHPYTFEINNNVIISVHGDTDNVSTLTNDVINKVLDAANLSAFKVTISSSGSRGE